MKPQPEEILGELIRIDSTNPPGNESLVARYLEKLFRDNGLTGEIIEPREGRGTFLARLGSGPRRLLFLSHSDVVPAGEGWSFPPFAGTVEGGVVRGRGALDCKGLLAAQVSAFLSLAHAGFSGQGELILAAVADEEMGGGLGAGYLIANHLDRIKADYAVNEGADLPVDISGKLAYFLQVGEKGTAWCRLRTSGVAGHGSLPTLAQNAIVKMARAVSRLHHYRAEVVLIPEVETLLAKLAELCSVEAPGRHDAMWVDDLLERLPLEKPFIETLRSMTRMTVSPNIISGGSKTNIVPDSCEAEVDIRILPGQDLAYVEKELRLVIGQEVEIEFTEYRAPSFSSAEEPFYKLLEEVTLEMAGPGAICLPVISPGSTDSKYLRGAGIPAYGIGHMEKDFDRGVRTTVHGRDERIDVASLRFAGAFLEELARRYLG